MGFYKIRPGSALGHNGETKHSGDVIELSDRVAAEVRWSVDPCDAHGTVIPSADVVAIDLSGAQAHERLSILEAAVARARRDLEAAEAQLAHERTAHPDSKPAKPVKADPKADPKAAAAAKRTPEPVPGIVVPVPVPGPVPTPAPIDGDDAPADVQQM